MRGGQTIRWLLPGALALAVLLVQQAPALAQDGFRPSPGGPGQQFAPESRNSGGISLEEAVRRVAERTEGRVLGARTVRRGERRIHEVRVLVAQGRVRVFDVDARSGEIR